MKRDDLFTISGETFHRTWNGERYDWTSSDGRLVCWCSERKFVRGHAVHEYSATLDGYPSTKVWPTLTAVMAASVASREAWDLRQSTRRDAA